MAVCLIPGCAAGRGFLGENNLPLSSWLTQDPRKALGAQARVGTC